jgi:enoyl-CoA hydratase/carnithine racemase
MTYETLLVERQNCMAYVTLNRPAALNALNTALRRDLRDFFTAARDDDEIREAVVRGLELSLEEGLKVEAELSILLRTTEDRMEGARAFKEKRPPQFRGR